MQVTKRTSCNEAKRQRHDDDTQTLELDPSSPGDVKYKLKYGSHLHLYISQLPCNIPLYLQFSFEDYPQLTLHVLSYIMQVVMLLLLHLCMHSKRSHHHK